MDAIPDTGPAGLTSSVQESDETECSPAVANRLAASIQIDQAAAEIAAGQLQQAFDRVKAILAQNDNHPRALGLLGQIAVVMERPALGLTSLQRAVALDPRLEHRIWLSLCLAKLDCQDDALREIFMGVEAMPPTANASFAVGMVFQALGRHADAALHFANCVARDATRAAAHHRYARSLQATGRNEQAVASYLEAVRHGSRNADYYADLSSGLSDLGCFEEACAAGQTAVQLDPTCIVGYNNLGHALHNLNRSAEALNAYEQAIAMSATYAKANFGYAVALLKCGDFTRGWRQYEWRWRDCQRPRNDLAVPLWQGQDVSGQTILLHAEQGLGDTLQFVRFAPLVAARGSRVILEVPGALVRLLRHIDGVSDVIARGDQVPPIDLHCPLASLPLAFKLQPDTIPAAPYLRLPAEETAHQDRTPRDRVTGPADPPDLVVGLVWAGDPRQSEPRSNLIDRRRSTTLDTLAPLFDIAGVRFFSFQFGQACEQVATAMWPVSDAMTGVADFADTALRLAGIDLLISVDTSMAHLAGGLGRPVWMLSRFDGCWRWMEGRSDTSWYPSMRIFRQPALGDWSGLVAEVAVALREVVLARQAVAESAIV